MMKVLTTRSSRFSARFGCIADGCGTSGRLETASAQDSHSIEIARSGSQQQQSACRALHWPVQIGALFPARDSSAQALKVTFEPGARMCMHKHPLGQTLIITEGIGLGFNSGRPDPEIRKGDVRLIRGVKHWQALHQIRR